MFLVEQHIYENEAVEHELLDPQFQGILDGINFSRCQVKEKILLSLIRIISAMVSNLA
jgi:hypothetical protein